AMTPPAAQPATSPLAAAFAQPASVQSTPAPPPAFAAPAPAPAPAAQRPAPPAPPARAASAAGASMDVHKLKFEIMRLESMVKKLQADLESERQYSRALEEHVKTLQESE
ncbi:MAG TPA: hypothetical protein VGR50_00465, partial [Terriglobales bacterium]|nr:hypothetical protein [Terriglobales bacterium]